MYNVSSFDVMYITVQKPVHINVLFIFLDVFVLVMA